MAPSGSTISKFEKFTADAVRSFLEASPSPARAARRRRDRLKPASAERTTNSRLQSAYVSRFLERSIMAGLVLAIVFTTLAHGAVEPWSVALFELIVIVVLLLWSAKAVVDRCLEMTIPTVALPLATFLLLGLAQSVAFTNQMGQRTSLSMDVEATRHAV